MMCNSEFRQLYDTYYPDVLRFVRGFISSEQDVEEIVQEVFIRIFRNYHQFRRQSQLKTWILAIARNSVIDYWRRTKREKSNPAVEYESVPESHFRTDSNDEPSAQVAKADELARIRACISRLPESMRIVLMCRAIHNLSTHETAETMGWSSTRVRVTYSRALKKLREIWRAEEGAELQQSMI